MTSATADTAVPSQTAADRGERRVQLVQALPADVGRRDHDRGRRSRAAVACPNGSKPLVGNVSRRGRAPPSSLMWPPRGGRPATSKVGMNPRSFPKPCPRVSSISCQGVRSPGDLMITKRSWGAFSATALDLELRRPGIRTIVLGGVPRNSTSRSHGPGGGVGARRYELVIARDATTSLSVRSDECSMLRIFPRIARITDSSAVSFSSV